VKTKKQIALRQLLVGVLSAGLVLAAWQVHGEWEPEMRLWKSFGVGAFFLIWFVAFIGPAARLVPPLTRIITWRREFGIWFTRVALVHGFLILDGWARWEWRGLLG
jgi:methionine sulfoxide reductase heme-binding subunit